MPAAPKSNNHGIRRRVVSSFFGANIIFGLLLLEELGSEVIEERCCNHNFQLLSTLSYLAFFVETIQLNFCHNVLYVMAYLVYSVW